jgi:hypothetical protein
MALERAIADGTEGSCHKCGQEIRPATIKVKRPSKKPGMPGTFTVGGASYVWVHEKCSPTRTKGHHWKK